jgi:hypothetical protein
MMASLEAVLLIKKLGLQPRRPIRALFFVNEENGGAGDRAYGAMIGDALKNHVAAIVDDRGAEQPVGFGPAGDPGPRDSAQRGASMPNSTDYARYFQRIVCMTPWRRTRRTGASWSNGRE